jgi:phage terminase large subunit-like protein
VTITLERLKRVDAIPGGSHVLDWYAGARREQLWPVGDWFVWLLLGGRGSGKTRAAVEATIDRVFQGYWRRSALVARTSADGRDVLIEGESGIMAKAPADFRPIYEPSKRRLVWPNGALTTLYSADEPDLLRGPQHDGAVCDELATWKQLDAWSNLLLGLRLGQDPRVIVATTPRPTPMIRQLAKDKRTRISAMTTYDNLVNLSPTFQQQVLEQYEGTRLGRQELLGEILEDVEGALWSHAQLEACVVVKPPQKRWLHDNNWLYADDLRRTVVGVDPASTSGPESDLTGIVVAAKGADGRGYILADRSCRATPDGWGRRVIQAYLDWEADAIIVEKNQGGEMCELTIRTAAQAMGVAMPRLKLLHAKESKRLRAEPVAALFEQHRMSLCTLEGPMLELRDEMSTFVPDGGFSPDRLDAMVHAVTELMLSGAGRLRFRSNEAA